MLIISVWVFEHIKYFINIIFPLHKLCWNLFDTLISIANFSKKEDFAGCRSLKLWHSRRILLLCAGFGQTFLVIISYFRYLLLGLSLLFSSFSTMLFHLQPLLFPSCHVSMETQGQFCTQKAVIHSSWG